MEIFLHSSSDLHVQLFSAQVVLEIFDWEEFCFVLDVVDPVFDVVDSFPEPEVVDPTPVSDAVDCFPLPDVVVWRILSWWLKRCEPITI